MIEERTFDGLTLRVGQHWRDDDGYLMRIVGFAGANDWPYVRHVNARSGGIVTNPAWFKRWTMTRDAPRP